MYVNGPYGPITQDKFRAWLKYVTAGRINCSNINLILILRSLTARCTTCHCRKISSRPEELLGVFAIQEVKSVANCNDSFGITARGIQRILVGNIFLWGTRWHSWLRHCATSRKVAGTIPHVVVGIFYLLNPFGHTMALGSSQPVTEMSTRRTS